jgi:hypothetical protein
MGACALVFDVIGGHGRLRGGVSTEGPAAAARELTKCVRVTSGAPHHAFIEMVSLPCKTC